MEHETIHIVYATDKGYLPFVTISCYSLIENNPDALIHIHVLGLDLNDEDIKHLESVIPSDTVKMTFYAMTRLKEKLTIDVPSSYPIIGYARLFLPSILPSFVKRVLYLDGDTIVRGSVLPFYHANLGSSLVGGIMDPTLSAEYKRRTGIAMDEPYINAGVLIIPLDRWREEGIEQLFVEHLHHQNGSVFHFDQGIINYVCAGRKHIISPKYNCMTNYLAYPYLYLKKYNVPFYTETVIHTALQDPIIVHFTGHLFGRPWEMDCVHPFKEEFVYYKNHTLYGCLPLKRKHLSFIDRLSNWMYRKCPFFIYAFFIRSISFISYIKNLSV